LERHAASRTLEEHPDPLWVTKERGDEKSALVCALFGYGNAAQIVKFLRGLDFSLLDATEADIRAHISAYYRFQRPRDVAELFVTLSRAGSLEEPFMEGCKKSGSVLGGLERLIKYLRSLNSYKSYGYDFLLGSGRFVPSGSPHKRWMMYLRWMVRRGEPDLGLWREVDPSKLIIPLDTHTFAVSRRLGLLRRKNPTLAAAMELTDALRRFDPKDPVRYDFALYRIGQLSLA